MITKIPITKARINLGAIVKRARLKKEYFILEKDGYPVAGLMDIDEFEDYLEKEDPRALKALEKSQKEYLAGNIKPARIALAELRKKK